MNDLFGANHLEGDSASQMYEPLFSSSTDDLSSFVPVALTRLL